VEVTVMGKRTAFGRELAKLRIDFDESTADMAAKLDMSGSNLNAMEMGRNRVSFEVVHKIKEFYGKDLEDVFIGEGRLPALKINLSDIEDQEIRRLAVAIWKVSTGHMTEAELWDSLDISLGEKPIERLEVLETEAPKPRPKHVPPPLPDDVDFLSVDELGDLGDLEDLE